MTSKWQRENEIVLLEKKDKCGCWDKKSCKNRPCYTLLRWGLLYDQVWKEKERKEKQGKELHDSFNCKVVYKSCTSVEVSLEQKPHFLRNQVAHKPHSNRSRTFSELKLHKSRSRIEAADRKKWPGVVDVGLNPTAFACQMFVCIWNNFLTIAVMFHFHFTCARLLLCFYGFCRRRTFHISRAQIKVALE